MKLSRTITAALCAAMLCVPLVFCGCGGSALKTTDDSANDTKATQAESAESADEATTDEAAEVDEVQGDAADEGYEQGGSSESGGYESEPAASEMIYVSVQIDASAGGGGVSYYDVELYPGASVYDALVATGSAISGSSNYVRGINGLKEFANGGQSGWKYQVNGSFPSAACDTYTLYDGDYVVWVFVEEA